MTSFRQYDIPTVGNFNISYIAKRIEIVEGQFIEPGYYGGRGAGFITERYETPKGAEKALKKEIF